MSDIVGGSTLPYLQTAAGEAFIAAIKEAGRKPKLVHALRTLPQQYMVHYQYIHHLCDIPLAASPGTSPHERGIAIDIKEHQSWIEVLKRHHWIWRGPADRPHFNFHGPQDADFGIAEIKAFQQTWNKNNPNDLLKVDGSYGPNTEGKLLAGADSRMVRLSPERLRKQLNGCSSSVVIRMTFSVAQAFTPGKERTFVLKAPLMGLDNASPFLTQA